MFLFTPNTFCDIWSAVLVPPWISGDPPTAANVPCQQVRPYYDVSGNPAAGFSTEMPHTERIFFGSEFVFTPADSTHTSESFTVIRLAGDDRFWMGVISAHAHLEGGLVSYQQVWLRRIPAVA